VNPLLFIDSFEIQMFYLSHLSVCFQHLSYFIWMIYLSSSQIYAAYLPLYYLEASRWIIYE